METKETYCPYCNQLLYADTIADNCKKCKYCKTHSGTYICTNKETVKYFILRDDKACKNFKPKRAE